jgi:hypothetical protein
MMISEMWYDSRPISTSQAVQAISDSRDGGPVEARFDRQSGNVLLLFTESASRKLSEDIVEAVGGLDPNMFRRDIMGGELVVHVPAEVYVDKLGGDVPGLKRQVEVGIHLAALSGGVDLNLSNTSLPTLPENLKVGGNLVLDPSPESVKDAAKQIMNASEGTKVSEADGGSKKPSKSPNSGSSPRGPQRGPDW